MSRSIRGTVLVVDDDPIFSFELGGSLRGAGYSVVSAAKANEAAALLAQQNIDVAIVDLNLPDKSGLQLIHENKHSAKPVRILATTGSLSDLHLEIATYMGADLALRKGPDSSGAEVSDDEWITAVNTLIAVVN